MSSAGYRIDAGRIPGELIGDVLTRTANVGTFTVETTLDTLVVPLVSGRRYWITWNGAAQSSVADGAVRFRIREDTSAGTQIALRQAPMNAVVNQSFGVHMRALYTAVATANKTFVITGVRQNGTGNITAVASTDAPTFTWAEYVSG